MPILAFLGKIILSAAVFAGVEKIIGELFDKDEDTITDEIFSATVAAGVLSKIQTKQVADAARVLPLPSEVTTPQAASEYLLTLSKNEAGLKALNERLGGFAPLAIKFTQTAAKILPKLENITFKKVAFITSLITFLFWLPSLIQQYMDHGVFAPEQANKIFNSWGLPFRWPISETRATETALKEAQLERTLAGLTGAIRGDQPRFIIRMAETSKPQLFTGILFAAPLSKPEAFNRVLDDEITDLADLQNDLKLNIAAWTKGLAGRISVAVSVRNNPVISASERLSGTWLVASLSYNLVDGGRIFLDTIPLGPINPVKYMPKMSEVKTLEQQIMGEFKPEQINELIIPPSSIQALTKEGQIVPVLPKAARPEIPTPAAVAAPAAPSFVAPTVQTSLPQSTAAGVVIPGLVSQEDYRERGLAVPPGVPTRAVVQAQQGAISAGPVIGDRPGAFRSSDIVKIVNTLGSGANLRATPSLSGPRLTALEENTRITVTGLWTEADGFVWWPVQFGNVRGYMAGQYLMRI